jgi:hypothetical protein
MNEDGPNGSPYEMLAKHDQSETKRDTISFEEVCLEFLKVHVRLALYAALKELESLLALKQAMREK